MSYSWCYRCAASTSCVGSASSLVCTEPSRTRGCSFFCPAPSSSYKRPSRPSSFGVRCVDRSATGPINRDASASRSWSSSTSRCGASLYSSDYVTTLHRRRTTSMAPPCGASSLTSPSRFRSSTGSIRPCVWGTFGDRRTRSSDERTLSSSIFIW